MIRHRTGFTLVEILVALALSLVIMSGLGYAFGFLGRKLQDGRAEVHLSGTGNSISVRLRDELRRVTVKTTPPISRNEGAGYFMYYEGPMCDASTAIYGQQPTSDNELTFADSKWGDCDDYVAFTAKAPPGSWFTGKVPQFVVQPGSSSFTPVEITSQYAEIVYWVSPEWEHGPWQDYTLGPRSGDTYDNGVPVFKDGEYTDPSAPGYRLPDRYVLRRRVLLIRPDLNVNGHLPIPSGHRDDFWFHREFARGTSPPVTYGYVGNTDTFGFDHNWLMGMRLAYQLCDLSVSRTGRPNDLVYTPPADFTGAGSGIKANSLSELTDPHNRFAHVRIPGIYYGFGAPVVPPNPPTPLATTMPLLALTGSNAYLSLSSRANNGFPMAVFPRATSPANRVRPMFNGWLLPHFQLGDYAAGPTLTNDSNWDRSGEDVIASGVLAFDVQAYDPLAPVLVTPGRDQICELGLSGSDDLAIEPDDPAFWSVLVHGTEARREIVPPNPIPAEFPDDYPPNAPNLLAPFPSQPPPPQQPPPVFLSHRGTFVDLGYVLQSGGTSKNLWTVITRPRTLVTDPYVPHGNLTSEGLLQTPFSGFTGRPGGVSQATLANTMVSSLQKSGRAIFNATTSMPSIVVYQPVFDTFTDAYESDGFNQQLLRTVNGITYLGTMWTHEENLADEFTNGIDDPASTTGADDESERETGAPFPTELRAVRIRIRIEDDGTKQMKQFTLIHNFVN
jgi:prepilin-type N-terminal cleavage/methylation domain-containing protein